MHIQIKHKKKKKLQEVTVPLRNTKLKYVARSLQGEMIQENKTQQ